MWLIFFLIFNLLISNTVISADVGEECRPNANISNGICTLLPDCPQAIGYLKEKKHHPFERCGFNNYDEIVCCPRASENNGSSENPRITKRIVESECEKIIEESIPNVNPHIIGGEEADLGEFPHMVALGFDRGDGYVFDCGGSLLSKNYVLTAAHCIDTLDDIQPTIARAGVKDISGNTFNADTDYRIVETIKHPNYTRRFKYHDLALLRLQENVRISKYLYPICIETGELAAKAALVVAGWGKTSNMRNTKSDVLLKADLIPVLKEECSTFYTNWRKLPQGVTNEQVCAGDPAGQKDTCQGDSGGPLHLVGRDNLFRLVGVTSFGRGCGSAVPGVYTHVAKYLDWIESIVWRK